MDMDHVTEASATLQKSGNRWKVVLITPGKGSSGTYTEEMLRSTGPDAFPAGTHSYIDHTETGARNPRDLLGVLAENAHYEDGIGLVSNLEVMPHYADFVAAVGPHTGMSIFASCEKALDPTTGDTVIESLIPDIMNSVDMVSYAGRGGALAEKLLESARSSFDIKTSSALEDSGTAPAASRNTEGKETSKMEIDELATRVETLAESLTALTALVTPLAESLTAEQTEKARKEAEEAAKAEKAPELDFSLIAEAAIQAGLPEAARKVVYNQVRLGAATPEEAIESQKAYVESVQASVRETLGGTVRVGTESVNQDFSVSRWTVTL